jgi:hypothetical protein
MEMTLKNNTPVSAFAAAGVCTVSPDPRFAVASPAVITPVVAQLPQVHQAQILASGVKRGYMGLETRPSTKLGGSALRFRSGIPPRRRPV